MSVKVGSVTSDVLVVGGGGAAVRAAIEAATPGVRVDLIDKGEVGKSGSSPRCLTGFATVLNDKDTVDLFCEEWNRASGGISDRNLVRKAVSQSREAVEQLEAMGVAFLRDEQGKHVLYRGAGHGRARGLTRTGEPAVHVLKAEAQRRGVNIHEGRMVTRLFGSAGGMAGAAAIARDGSMVVFSAGAVVLAAGGVNKLYPNIASPITNPIYWTSGDAFCLAFDAGAPLIDMEFTQFRDSPAGASRFGGRLLNRLGERFMEKYAPQVLEKAPRCTVVEAIYRELQAGRGPIIWEVAGISELQAKHEPGSRYFGKEFVEVSFDFQRILGGARIDEKGATLVAGLFAAGESAGGLHGGNRMQGNAFLETQVFGAEAGKSAAIFAAANSRKKIDPAEVAEEEARLAGLGGDADPAEVAKSIQKIMIDRVGIVKDAAGLREALASFEEMRKGVIPRLSRDNLFATLDANNLLRTGEMVARAALYREETRRTHIRADYPATEDRWMKHVCITRRGRDMELSTVPVRTE